MGRTDRLCVRAVRGQAGLTINYNWIPAHPDAEPHSQRYLAAKFDWFVDEDDELVTYPPFFCL